MESQMDMEPCDSSVLIVLRRLTQTATWLRLVT